MIKHLFIIALLISPITADNTECMIQDSLINEISNKQSEIDSLKNELRDPQQIYKNIITEMLDSGKFKSIREANDEYKKTYSLSLVLKELDNYRTILVDLKNRGIEDKDVDTRITQFISEIDKESSRLVKKRGDKNAVRGSINLSLVNKDDDEIFYDMVTLILNVENNTNNTVVGCRIKVKILNKLKKPLFNQVLETDWTVAPLSSSSGDIMWTFKDNQFINGEIYDLLFSVAKSGNYDYSAEVQEVIYE